MQPHATDRTVTATLPAQMQSKAFSIAVSEKAFRILIDGLYSDKIGSIVRELCTNAFDGHARAGNLDRPFHVTLPSMGDPEFRVRDYGSGMTHEFTMDLYSTLFASDKGTTNDEVGMLGLGSKSPFAYTDSFHIKVHEGNGTTRIYTVHIQADGIPVITHAANLTTNEERGMEVSFAVNPADFRTFHNAMQNVADGFDVRPLFIGDRGARPWAIELDNGAIKAGRNGSGGWDRHLLVRQGCVIYPVKDLNTHGITMPPIPEGWTLMVTVPIGTVAVTASREALEMTPPTVAGIKRILASVGTRLEQYVKDQIAAGKDDYERAALAHQFMGWPCVHRNATHLDITHAYALAKPMQDILLAERRAMSPAVSHGITDEQIAAKHGVALLYRYYFNSQGTNYRTIWGASILDFNGMTLLIDQGDKMVRRQKRIRHFVNSKSNVYVMLKPTKAQVDAIKKYLHLTDGQVMDIDSIPDVPPPVRSGNAGPVSPLTKAADLAASGTPWVPREGRTWSFPEFNMTDEDGVPYALRIQAEFLGLPVPTRDQTLPPSQSAKADPAMRWDVVLKARWDAVDWSAQLPALLQWKLIENRRIPYLGLSRSEQEAMITAMVRTVYPTFTYRKSLPDFSSIATRIPKKVANDLSATLDLLLKTFPLVLAPTSVEWMAYVQAQIDNT